MSEVFELVEEGVLCERCGSMIDGNQTGFPRKCDDCEDIREEVDEED